MSAEHARSTAAATEAREAARRAAEHARLDAAAGDDVDAARTVVLEQLQRATA